MNSKKDKSIKLSLREILEYREELLNSNLIRKDFKEFQNRILEFIEKKEKFSFKSRANFLEKKIAEVDSYYEILKILINHFPNSLSKKDFKIIDKAKKKFFNFLENSYLLLIEEEIPCYFETNNLSEDINISSTLEILNSLK